MKKPPRTHVLGEAHVSDDIHVMLCGMRSSPERPLIFTSDRELSDCKRCEEEAGVRASSTKRS